MSCDRFRKPSGLRPAFTLLEVLGALVLVGGLLTACIVMRTESVRLVMHARSTADATDAADRILSQLLLEQDATLLPGMSGTVDRWGWRVVRVADGRGQPILESYDLQLLCLEVRSLDGTSSARIEIVSAVP